MKEVGGGGGGRRGQAFVSGPLKAVSPSELIRKQEGALQL